MRVTKAATHIRRVARGRDLRQVSWYVRHHPTGSWRYYGLDRPSGKNYLNARGFTPKQQADIMALAPRFLEEKAFIARTNFNYFMREIPSLHRRYK